MISDIEKLYSPSQWCYRRCSSEEAVSKHLEFTTTGTIKYHILLLLSKNGPFQ